MTPTPARTRKLCLAGLLLSAAMIGLFSLSMRWQFGYAGRRFAVTITPGVVAVGLLAGPPPRGPGFWASRVDWKLVVWPRVYRFARVSVLTVPLWIPFLLVAAPTFLAWRRTRRPPAWRCRNCRYDLTGNVSGVCPECGSPT